MPRLTLAERLDALSVPEPNSGCTLWIGMVDDWGYGRIKTGPGNRRQRSHRLVWELEHGPIPPGVLVCHSCDMPPCINGRHLFLGDDALNAADRDAKGRNANANKTSCAAGHPYDSANTYTDNVGGRHCRTCRKQALLRHYARREETHGSHGYDKTA